MKFVIEFEDADIRRLMVNINQTFKDNPELGTMLAQQILKIVRESKVKKRK